MKERVIKQMTEVVRDVMTSFQRDFEKNKEELDGYEGAFIWQVAPSHTYLHLIDFDWLVKEFQKESSLYFICQRQTWADACLASTWSEEYCFIYDGNEFRQTTREKAKEAWENARSSALNKLVEMGVELPTDFKIRIEFNSVETRRYFLEQARYARQHNDDSLLRCLRGFRRYTKVTKDHKILITRDYYERCFMFYTIYDDNEKTGLWGSIKFHGYPKEGYKQNGSCQIEPSYGWSIHT